MNTDRKLVAMRADAAAWHERLQGDSATEGVRSAFAGWLAECPGHRAAFAEVERTWQLLQASADDPQMLVLRHEAALRLTRTSLRHGRQRQWAAAAAVIVVLGAIAAMAEWPAFGGRTVLAWLSRPAPNQRYATTTGERLSFTLVDGSHVTLDTQSELNVEFSKTERTVRLKRGQALFEVAKDSVHPFVAVAGGRRFIAVGTAFDVRVSAEQLKITMVEGTVRVEKLVDAGGVPSVVAPERARTAAGVVADAGAGAAPHHVMTIKAGEQLVVDSQQVDHLFPANAGHETSWLRGEIVFEDSTLSEAVAEINRYAANRIELTDPGLGTLRLSGTFSTSRPELFVEAVTGYFPVIAGRGTGGTVFLSRREESRLPGSGS